MNKLTCRSTSLTPPFNGIPNVLMKDVKGNLKCKLNRSRKLFMALTSAEAQQMANFYFSHSTLLFLESLDFVRQTPWFSISRCNTLKNHACIQNCVKKIPLMSSLIIEVETFIHKNTMTLKSETHKIRF